MAIPVTEPDEIWDGITINVTIGKRKRHSRVDIEIFEVERIQRS